MARAKRSWQPREMQMVTEFLTKFYAARRWKTRVRLGSPPEALIREEMTPEERAMVGAWRRWADAVVYPPPDLIIIEAAIRPAPGKISQLELYALLLPHTPEFLGIKYEKIRLILLFAIEDPATTFLARQKGIECVEYKPTWLPAYLRILMPRERRGSLPGKEISP